MTNPKEKIVIRFEQWEAARAMLAALKRVYIEMGEGSAKGRAIDLLPRQTVEQICAAIAQAETAGITLAPT